MLLFFYLFFNNTILLFFRIGRNYFMDNYPPNITTNNICSPEELKKMITLVITVKDTCFQKNDILYNVAQKLPAPLDIIYVSPNIVGCVNLKNDWFYGKSKIGNYQELVYDGHKAPIEGFHVAYHHIKTPYAVLIHNDAYPMESSFYCELYLGLKENPEFPIAAPTIYEKGESNIYVPHGHHENLHVRPTKGKYNYLIDYDISYEMATRRVEGELYVGKQIDFLEDHAFFVKKEDYREYLDPEASFTMEYMDMIMNMRVNGTAVWYVPTARVVFDVSLSKFRWNDLPYFVYKRSEEIGLKVRHYLSDKWNTQFPNTGIWNFVRYNFLSNLTLIGDKIPENPQFQYACILSWFQSVGFNRFNGKILPDALNEYESSNHSIVIERIIENNNYCESKKKQSAYTFLPIQQNKNILKPKLKISSIFQQIGINVRSCNDNCGMIIQNGNNCICYTMIPNYNINNPRIKFIFEKLSKILELIKLPGRAILYVHMKLFKKNIISSDVFCPEIKDYDDKDINTSCKIIFNYTTQTKLLKWSWF